ncbi:MAG: molybdopterin cofactor-binding domain-containing protein, partial [Actinomycetota bacterium]
AIAAAADSEPRNGAPPRSFDDAQRQCAQESASPQHVGTDVPTGAAGFADDTAPRDALVAVPLPPGVDPAAVDAREVAGRWWVLGATLADARARAEKIQGRRTTVGEKPPLAFPVVAAPAHAVRLATSWVEPAYLEPDASWCVPGGDPASPLANGGAFGAKSNSLAPVVARALADDLGRAVRVVYSREDTIRLGPKRPPIAAIAWLDGKTVRIRGAVANTDWSSAGRGPGGVAVGGTPVGVEAEWTPVSVAGPPVGAGRAVGWAEEAILVAGALDAAGVGSDGPLDVRVTGPEGATADARVHVDAATGAVTGIEVQVDVGRVLDAVVLRSYCIGAAHMALGWVCTEGLAVDPESGEVLDLTIRSFGIVRPAKMPPVTVMIAPGRPDDDATAPGASDAVFAAVAAATWNAVTRAEGHRPEAWPARTTRAAGALRR